MLLAVPAIMLAAASRVFALRSAIFCLAISSTCAFVILATLSLLGFALPLSMPHAFVRPERGTYRRARGCLACRKLQLNDRCYFFSHFLFLHNRGAAVAQEKICATPTCSNRLSRPEKGGECLVLYCAGHEISSSDFSTLTFLICTKSSSTSVVLPNIVTLTFAFCPASLSSVITPEKDSSGPETTCTVSPTL